MTNFSLQLEWVKKKISIKSLSFFQIVIKIAYVMTVIKRTAKASNPSRALYHVDLSYSINEPMTQDVANRSTNHSTVISRQTPPLAQ